jgi:predicted nucleic acid-binding protein
MKVVTNASPLIVLCNAGLADLWPQVCAEVLVPTAVWNEVTAGGKDDCAAQILPLVNWAKRIEVTADDPIIRAWNLGAGETAVLNLAHSLPGHRALIDDTAARACAKTLDIPFIGAGGLLALAKRRGLIQSFDEALQAVMDAGLWLSGDIIKLLKQQAGE